MWNYQAKHLHQDMNNLKDCSTLLPQRLVINIRIIVSSISFTSASLGTFRLEYEYEIECE